MEELKQLLERNLEVSEKSLKILKKMHRAEIMRSIFGALKWVFIIGVTAYSFIQLQPYLDTLLKTYQNIFNTAQQFNNILPR